MPVRYLLVVVFFLSGLLNALPLQAARLHIAVAANFLQPARALAKAFEQDHKEVVLISFGSSGQLFSQIVNGAPFDLFLSADQALPARLVALGLTPDDKTFTYARGRLSLLAHDQALDARQALLSLDFSHLAIANPDKAPYGRAALEVLERLGLSERVSDRMVRGTSVAQALQFVKTGTADLAFVAESQVISSDLGAYWLVDDSLYKPILQDGVLLKGGDAPEAGRDFLTFLLSPAARSIIRFYGYDE